MFLSWLLEGIDAFIWRYLWLQARLMMRTILADAIARQRQQDDIVAARRKAQQQKRDRRDAEQILGWLKASQGLLGSCEIEPATAT